MPHPLRANIIAGIPALIDSAVKTATAKTKPFGSLTIARELLNFGQLACKGALSRLAPNETLHVGDDAVRDWLSAEAAGLAVFRLDRPHNSLRDLPAILES